MRCGPRAAAFSRSVAWHSRGVSHPQVNNAYGLRLLASHTLPPTDAWPWGLEVPCPKWVLRALASDHGPSAGIQLSQRPPARTHLDVSPLNVSYMSCVIKIDW